MFQSLMTTLLFLLIFTTSSFSTTDTIDIDKLSLQAKKENKHLLLFFHKYRCGFCEKMYYDTLDDSDIEELIEQYFIFVDGENSIVYGAIGYRDIDTFSLLLQYIYSGKYKVMEWEDYKSKVEYERED